jgi:hypothetical protein
MEVAVCVALGAPVLILSNMRHSCCIVYENKAVTAPIVPSVCNGIHVASPTQPITTYQLANSYIPTSTNPLFKRAASVGTQSQTDENSTFPSFAHLECLGTALSFTCTANSPTMKFRAYSDFHTLGIPV